jgi:phosphohistidine phosphatase
MAVRLHLLRHADAGDRLTWQGPDEARPLSDKGRRQAERLGHHLAAAGFRCDALLSSPKIRALETAEIVAAALGVAVRTDERLGGAFGLDGLAEILGDAGGPGRPVLVGHDPEFSDLAAELLGVPELLLRKGAVACIELDGEPEAGAGLLRWLLSPEILAG